LIEPEEPLEKPLKRRGVGAVAKGGRNEKKTHQWLEQHGYTVYTKPRMGHKAKSVDIFGLFDHVAVARNHPEVKQEILKQLEENRLVALNSVIFIQTKTNKLPSRRVIDEEYRSFNRSHFTGETRTTYPSVAIFVWKDNDNHPWILPVRKFIEDGSDWILQRHPDKLIVSKKVKQDATAE